MVISLIEYNFLKAIRNQWQGSMNPIKRLNYLAKVLLEKLS
jgi:hypothetical protein